MTSFLQGHPRLVSALSRLYSPLIGQQLDPNKQVTVSVGAYGVLFCAVQGLINPGDEVVIIEPFFDCYEPMVKVAGGIAHYCPLRPVNMHIDCLIQFLKYCLELFNKISLKFTQCLNVY